MLIRVAQDGDSQALVRLIAEFRAHLAGLRRRSRRLDPIAAGKELQRYLSSSCPIHVAESDDGSIVGYLVCRVDGDVVWAESLYVCPEWRRRGVGEALYTEAEKLADQLGGETVYNWVHPNNDAVIALLVKRGYTVLNLIELRRPLQGEEVGQRIAVGGHSFDY